MSNEDHANGPEDTVTESSSEPERTTPATLETEPGVRVESRPRELPVETFEGVRKRYDAIDGVVMVGVTGSDGAVLLQGEETVVPPGGDVEPGEDWLDAAARNVEELTGQPVAVDGAKLVEYTTWTEAGGEESFRTASVHVEATLDQDADGAETFRADPTPPAVVEHKYYQDDEAPTFGWYDTVPESVHENHVEHVELYLD